MIKVGFNLIQELKKLFYAVIIFSAVFFIGSFLGEYFKWGKVKNIFEIVVFSILCLYFFFVFVRFVYYFMRCIVILLWEVVMKFFMMVYFYSYKIDDFDITDSFYYRLVWRIKLFKIYIKDYIFRKSRKVFFVDMVNLYISVLDKYFENVYRVYNGSLIDFMRCKSEDVCYYYSGLITISKMLVHNMRFKYRFLRFLKNVPVVGWLLYLKYYHFNNIIPFIIKNWNENEDRFSRLILLYDRVVSDKKYRDVFFKNVVVFKDAEVLILAFFIGEYIKSKVIGGLKEKRGDVIAKNVMLFNFIYVLIVNTLKYSNALRFLGIYNFVRVDMECIMAKVFDIVGENLFYSYD